jgi:hypothetical protein
MSSGDGCVVLASERHGIVTLLKLPLVHCRFFMVQRGARSKKKKNFFRARARPTRVQGIIRGGMFLLQYDFQIIYFRI